MRQDDTSGHSPASYYSSEAFCNCTTALTSPLQLFPLNPHPLLGFKLLMNRRDSPPLSPCLPPSHFSACTKPASVHQNKKWTKPDLQIPKLLRQASHLAPAVQLSHPNWLERDPRSLTRSSPLRSDGRVWICQEGRLPLTRMRVERRREAPAKRRAESCRAQPRRGQYSSNGPLH